MFDKSQIPFRGGFKNQTIKLRRSWRVQASKGCDTRRVRTLRGWQNLQLNHNIHVWQIPKSLSENFTHAHAIMFYCMGLSGLKVRIKIYTILVSIVEHHQICHLHNSPVWITLWHLHVLWTSIEHVSKSFR